MDPSRFLASASVALLLATTSLAHSKVLQRWDFDGANPLGRMVIQGDRPAIIRDPRDPSNKVMRATLSPQAKRPERSEVMPGVIKFGEERWVGVRILRPAKMRGFTSSFQLGPISDAKRQMVGCFQLASYSNDIWHIRAYAGRGITGNGLAQPSGPIRFGEWDSWVFHVILRDNSGGLIQAWRDGKTVFKHSGANSIPGDIMRIKWGVYIGKGNTATEELHTLFDDIVIGDANSSLPEVSSRGS